MHAPPKLVASALALALALVAGPACRVLGGGGKLPPRAAVEQRAPAQGERTWLGPTLWGNRLQDWRFVDGAIRCVTPASSRGGWLPYRTAHELARRVDARAGAFRVGVEVDWTGEDRSAHAEDAAAGLLVGAGGAAMDPRSAAVIHQWPGAGAGLVVAVDAAGRLVVDDLEAAPDDRRLAAVPVAGDPPRSFRLDVSSELLGDGRARLVAWATDPARDERLAEASVELAAARLVGNVALVSHPGSRADGLSPARASFRRWSFDGAGVVVDLDAGLGAVAGAQYTVSGDVLKLTAQLMPMGADDPDEVRLETWSDGRWREAARVALVAPGWTAPFRVEGWDSSRTVSYRVRYSMPAGDGAGGTLDYTWQGSVAAEPEGETVVLAVLNCNHNNSHAIGGGWGLGDGSDRTAPNDWVQGMWFPHQEIVDAVAARDPDLLFFTGDQIYEGKSPSYADRANIELDYLYKWTLFVWAYRDLLAHTPAVTIPDDHDVYQGNLWGAGGRDAPGADNTGGYVHPAPFVRMVERTQTSHLPDPYDPTPVDQGIGVYYTDFEWGDVSFAVVEDRKFKSGCAGVLPEEVTPNRPDHVIDPDWDPSVADLEGLELLGRRQEEFLSAWASERPGRLRAVLSQSPFGSLSTHHGAGLVRYEADMDANGWPQAGRRRALERIRAAGAVHVTGDQHLATVVQHGLDTHGDGPWSFTGPAIANFYPRAWAPGVAGRYEPVPLAQCTGEFTDGFGNLVTVAAVANPGTVDRPETPSDLYDRMAGFGAVVFDKATGTVTFECWPRGVDPRAPGAWQYAGWPVTVRP